ncbi:MAG TPA: hypothetical protein P5121_10425 [Caldilineaceae bacterium]|nr:hypothetical protein [Caldilineaceae bacterium]
MAKPMMSVGWVLAAETSNVGVQDAYEEARTTLHTQLEQQFPQFHWQMELVQEYRYPSYGLLKPLPLLEMGVHEKLSRGWDFALVLVPNDLAPRARTFTIGVPSSALEVAVLSSARLGASASLADSIAALALHLLGHVWGLEHEDQSPMCPPESCDILRLHPFSQEQQRNVAHRLAEVADARVEEEDPEISRLRFYWRSLWADPTSVAVDILGYAPWRMPFRMGRLTAAAMVSIVFLLLGAEAWEVGVNTTVPQLVIGAFLTISMATAFLFWGQNLGEISRNIGWREQLIRTRIVVFATLLIGLTALWVVLWVLSFFAALYVPAQVTANWLGSGLGVGALARYAAFMATLGVLAGAIGGNLEEEDAVKAELFFDEET